MTGAVGEIWRSPLARFAVHSIRSGARTRVDGAVGGQGVVWQRSRRGDSEPEPRASRHADSLAAVLGDIIGLGPRSVVFDPGVGNNLSWPEVESVARPGTLHIVLWRPEGEGDERTALVVLDVDGYALVVPASEARRYRLEPVSPPLVWAELCSLIGRLQPALAALDGP